MLDNFKDSCYRYCYWLGDSLKRLLCIVSVATFTIFLAVTLYGGLYWAILPSSARVIPVRWDFTSCDVLGQPCSFIRSQVELVNNQMVKGNRYNVELLLDLPETPANREVGMFLACSTILPTHTATCTSAMMPFKPLLISSLESIILLPLHMAYIISSTQVLSIPLLDNHTEATHSSSQTSGILLELQTSKIQISNSRLKIWPCDLSGLRYLMYHYPLMSLVLGVLFIITVICLVGALTIARFLQPHRIVSAPSSRQKSNHDLADRQARARLNLEYRQARLREVQDQSAMEKVHQNSHVQSHTEDLSVAEGEVDEDHSKVD